MNLLQFFQKEAIPTETGLHLKTAIIQSLITQLKPLALVQHSIKGITLFVTAPEGSADQLAYYGVLQTPTFKGELDRSFADYFLEIPPNWSLKIAPAPPNVSIYTPLTSGLYMRIENASTSTVSYQATLRALVGKLWEETYELSPDPTQKHTIGRGKTPHLASGRVHRNDIAFIASDEPPFDASTCQDNDFVSRYHGYFLYDETRQQFAFKLAAGVFQSGHHTRILRLHQEQEEIIIVNNETILYYLQHGDQLQFNRKATLEFLIEPQA
ncbi:MAG: hypothetical protein U0Y10_25040 [Spirosomataceae bacterium]